MAKQCIDLLAFLSKGRPFGGLCILYPDIPPRINPNQIARLDGQIRYYPPAAWPVAGLSTAILRKESYFYQGGLIFVLVRENTHYNLDATAGPDFTKTVRSFQGRYYWKMEIVFKKQQRGARRLQIKGQPTRSGLCPIPNPSCPELHSLVHANR